MDLRRFPLHARQPWWQKRGGRSLYWERGLKSEEDSDSEPRYETNECEIEALLILSASSALCACLCPDSVCQGGVMITDCGLVAALLRRISWHWLHRPWPLCVSVRCLCMRTDARVCGATPSDRPWLYPLRVCQLGVTSLAVWVPASACVWACVCVSCCCRQGKSLSWYARELKGTPHSSVFGWVCFVAGVSRLSNRGPGILHQFDRTFITFVNCFF